MEISEAIVKSIRSFYSKKGFAKYEENRGKPMKYTKDYFDSVEEEMFPKKKKSPIQDEMEDLDGLEEESLDEEDLLDE